MSINELFGNESLESTTSARSLNGTAELTSISSKIAVGIIRSMEEQIDIYRERITQSAKDSKEMDTLLDEFRPWMNEEELNSIRNFSDETVESMLKSQQSKRSRLKSKAMTLDNYTNLMTATVAESLLREIYNKPKSAGFGTARRGALDYTPSDLEALEANQEALGKEIRNVQSKKSIMKSKADFSEADERWLQLLKAEQMLKDLRHSTAARIVEVDRTKEKLKEILSSTDLEALKAHDSKELLATIKELLVEEE